MSEAQRSSRLDDSDVAEEEDEHGAEIQPGSARTTPRAPGTVTPVFYPEEQDDSAAVPPAAADQEAADREPVPPAIDQEALAAEDPVIETPATPAYQAAGNGVPASGTTTTNNGTPADGRGPGAPLLSDASGLRAEWQRVQAGFVDDPRAAVSEAADLVEQTAQALIGALRQRQKELRVAWENASGNGSSATSPASATTVVASGADTEALRVLMQRYRTLFNQLSRP
jgi:hypothetical protein